MTEEERKASSTSLAELRAAFADQEKKAEMSRDRAKELALFARNLKRSLMGEMLP